MANDYNRPNEFDRPNEIERSSDRNRAPAPNKDNKHAKKAGDGTMTFMVWSMAGTVLAACSEPIFSDVAELAGGGGSSGDRSSGPIEHYAVNSRARDVRFFIDVDGNGQFDNRTDTVIGTTNDAGYFLANRPGDDQVLAADFTGATDIASGTSLSNLGVLRSLPYDGGEYVIISPLTDLLANAGAGVDPQDVLNSIFGMAPEFDGAGAPVTGSPMSPIITLEDVLDINNYNPVGLDTAPIERQLLTTASIALSEIEIEASSSTADRATILRDTFNDFRGDALTNQNPRVRLDTGETIEGTSVDLATEVNERITVADNRGGLPVVADVNEGTPIPMTEDENFVLLDANRDAVSLFGFEDPFGNTDSDGDGVPEDGSLRGVYIEAASTGGGDIAVMFGDATNNVALAGADRVVDTDSTLTDPRTIGSATFYFVSAANLDQLVLSPGTDVSGDFQIRFYVHDGEDATLADDATTLDGVGMLEIEVAPVNDAPELTVVVTDGAVTEAGGADNNTAGDVMANGSLTITDPDTGHDDFDFVGNTLQGRAGTSGAFKNANGVVENEMTSDGQIIGTYGTLTLEDDGTWSYALRDDDSDTQALDGGDTPDMVQDVFEIQLVNVDGTTQTSAIVPITIDVTGANDAPTDITTGGAAFAVSYDNDDIPSDGIFIATLSTEDVDAGDAHSYTITGTDMGSFSLRSSSAPGATTSATATDNNHLWLNAAAAPARAVDGTWDITMTSEDSAGLRISEDFSIRRTDATTNLAPTDITTTATGTSAALTATYDGDSVPTGGHVVAVLDSTDPNSGDSHTYSIVPNDNGPFTIRNGNQLVLREGASSPAPGDTLDVTVRSTDAGTGTGGLTFDKTFTITRAGNVSPTDITTTATGTSAALTATYDGDSVPTGGHVVAVLDSTDPNTDDAHTYSIVPNDNGPFTIRNGNQLVLREGASSPAPGDTLDVTVRSTDAGTGTGGLTFDKTFTITRAGNVSPTDITTTATGTSAALTATYDGNSVPTGGHVVAVLDSTDPNSGDSHTYSIVPNDNGPFTIRNGNQLVLREGASSPAPGGTLDVTVRSTDAGTGTGGLTFEKTFTITRAGNVDPASDQLAVSSEGAREHLLIYGVEFRALEDGAPPVRPNTIYFRHNTLNEVVFSADSDAFINYGIFTTDFSQVDIAGLWNNDPDSSTKYVATIIEAMPNIDMFDEWATMERNGAEIGAATDNGRRFTDGTEEADLVVTKDTDTDLTASGWLKVTGGTGDITFGNGGTGGFTASGQLGSAAHTDTRKYTFVGDYGDLVIDGDGDWVYTLGGTTAQDNAVTGLTSTIMETFRVSVIEDGSTRATQPITIIVNVVSDIPSVAPVINSGATGAALLENSLVAAGTAVYTAAGTPELPTSSIIWSLEAGTGDQTLLRINDTTGAVTFNAETTPDHETKDTYSFTVIATDSLNSTLTSNLAVSIAVTDVNEAPTDITTSPTGALTAIYTDPASVPTGSNGGLMITTLSTTDVDDGDTHTYTISAVATGTDPEAEAGAFMIRNDNELWLLPSPPDSVGAGDNFEIRITTRDSGGLTYSKDFTIFRTIPNPPTLSAPIPADNDVTEDDTGDATVTGGTLTFDDTDAGQDKSNLRVYVAAGATATDASTEVAPGATGTDTEIPVVGTYGTFTLTRTMAGDVTWTYTLDHTDADTQALRHGQEVTDQLAVIVYDADGVSSGVEIITIDVTGVNDAPVLVDPTGATITDSGTLNADSTATTGSLTGTFTETDIDTGDTHTFSASFGGTDGSALGTPVSGFSHSIDGDYGILFYNSGTGAYEYVRDEDGINTLGGGITDTDSFKITVTDDSGAANEAPAAKDLVFTINGANDAPTSSITVGTDTVAYDEDEVIDARVISFGDVDDPNNGLTIRAFASGAPTEPTTPAFDDASPNPITGSHSITSTYGMFIINRNDNDGEISVEYDLNEGNSNVLALQQTGGRLFDKLTVYVNDGDDTSTPETYVVTIEGPPPLFEVGELPLIEGTAGNDRFFTPLNGTTVAELIQGGKGRDALSGNGGDDVLIGGAGGDNIILGDPDAANDAEAGAETVVYRFASDGNTGVDGQSRAVDGDDDIRDFERGVDKLVLVDVSTGDPITSLTDFIADAPMVTIEVAGGLITAINITFALDAAGETNSDSLTIQFADANRPTVTAFTNELSGFVLDDYTALATLFGGDDFFLVGDASQLPDNFTILDNAAPTSTISSAAAIVAHDEDETIMTTISFDDDADDNADLTIHAFHSASSGTTEPATPNFDAGLGTVLNSGATPTTTTVNGTYGMFTIIRDDGTGKLEVTYDLTESLPAVENLAEGDSLFEKLTVYISDDQGDQGDTSTAQDFVVEIENPAPLTVESEGVREHLLIYGVEFRALEDGARAETGIYFSADSGGAERIIRSGNYLAFIDLVTYSQANIARIWNTYTSIPTNQDNISNTNYVATIIEEMSMISAPRGNSLAGWRTQERFGAETTGVLGTRDFPDGTDAADTMVTENNDLTASGWLHVTDATGDITFGKDTTSGVTVTGQLGGASGSAAYTDTRKYTYAGEYGNLVIDGDGDWVYTLGGTTTQNNDLAALRSTDNRTETFVVAVSQTGTRRTGTETIEIGVTGADSLVVTNEAVRAFVIVNGVEFRVNDDSNNPAHTAYKIDFRPTANGSADVISVGSLIRVAPGSNTAVNERFSQANIASIFNGAGLTSLDAAAIILQEETTTALANWENNEVDSNGIYDFNTASTALDLVVTEDDDADRTARGFLEVTGGTSPYTFGDSAMMIAGVNVNVYEGKYGDLIVHADGNWIYVLNNDLSTTNELSAEDTETDRFTVIVSDSSMSAIMGRQQIEIEVNGANEANVAPTSVIMAGSDTAATIANDGTETADTIISFDDANDYDPNTSLTIYGISLGDETEPNAPSYDDAVANGAELTSGATPTTPTTTTVNGTYGDFSITRTDGTGTLAVTYDLDEDNFAVENLAHGASLFEKLTVYVNDGEDTSTAQEFLVTIAGPMPLFEVGELTVTAATTGTADFDSLTGMPSTNELFQGGDSVDTITTNGGNDVVIGGSGTDTINLGTSAQTGAETVVYRFESDGNAADGGWRATDRGDTINNFEIGVDKLVLVDVSDGTAPITSLTDLIADTLDRPAVQIRVTGTKISRIFIRFELGATDTDTIFARAIEINLSSDTQLDFADFMDDFELAPQSTDSYILKQNDDAYGKLAELFGSTETFDGILVGDASQLPVGFTILEGPDPFFSINELTPVGSPFTGALATDELIQGSDGSDVINTRGGNDVVIGGEGGDNVTLGTNAQTGAETVVYRFESDGDADADDGWTATDAGEIISNFERGIDKLILVDIYEGIGTPIASLNDLINDANDRPAVSVEVDADADSGKITEITILFERSAFSIDSEFSRRIEVRLSSDTQPDFSTFMNDLERVGSTNNYNLKQTSYGKLADLFGAGSLIVGPASQLPDGLDILDNAAPTSTISSAAATVVNDEDETITTTISFEDDDDDNADLIIRAFASGATTEPPTPAFGANTPTPNPITTTGSNGFDGTYGRFTITRNDGTDGTGMLSVVYDLDDMNNTAVMNLGAGDSLIEKLTVYVNDGENTPIAQEFVVTIEGPTPPLFEVEGLIPITGTAGDDKPLKLGEPSVNELLQGGDGDDQLSGNGGNDVFIGGAGSDRVVFGRGAGEEGAETAVYRFTSDGSTANGNWEATDAAETIDNFERGIDKLVLVDVSDGTAPITSLADFIADTDDRPMVSVALDFNNLITNIYITFDFDSNGVRNTFSGPREIALNLSSANRLLVDPNDPANSFHDHLGPIQANSRYDLTDYNQLAELFGGEEFLLVGDASQLPDDFTILEGPDPLTVESEGARSHLLIYGVEFRQLVDGDDVVGETNGTIFFPNDGNENIAPTTSGFGINTLTYSQANIANLWNTYTDNGNIVTQGLVATIIEENDINTLAEWRTMEDGGAGVRGTFATRDFTLGTDEADTMVTEGSDLTASGWLHVTDTTTGDITFGEDETNGVTVTGRLGGESGSAANTDTRKYTYAGIYGNLVIDGDGDWVYTLGGSEVQNNALAALTSTNGGTDPFEVTVRETGGAMRSKTEMIEIAVTGADVPAFATSRSGTMVTITDTDSTANNVPAPVTGTISLTAETDVTDLTWTIAAPTVTGTSQNADYFFGFALPTSFPTGFILGREYSVEIIGKELEWSFMPNEKINDLNAGESVTFTYSITVTNVDGTTNQDLVVTLNGFTPSLFEIPSGPGAGAAIPGTVDSDFGLNGTTAAELIQAGDGSSDQIFTNGGDDVVIGGLGLDFIHLGDPAVPAQAGAETVVYRFESGGGQAGQWLATDANDTINNFEIGVDKFVLVDVSDDTPITNLAAFDTHDNRPVVTVSTADAGGGVLDVTKISITLHNTDGQEVIIDINLADDTNRPIIHSTDTTDRTIHNHVTQVGTTTTYILNDDASVADIFGGDDFFLVGDASQLPDGLNIDLL